MTDSIDLNEMVKKNPKLDITRVQRTLEVMKELRDAGITKQTEFDIGNPFSRKSTVVSTPRKGK